MSLYKDSTLAMLPTAYKDGKLYSVRPTDGSGDFTFSRGTTATRVASSGYIEKGRENLLLQSNQFDTTWVNANINVTSGQSGYDSSNDAWKIDLTASGGQLRQEGLSYSGVNTFSVYLKAGSLGFARILLFASPNNQVDLNLTTGATSLGVGIVADSEDVGGGWFRFSITANLTSATRVYIYPCQAIGDFTASSGNIYIQDAQLEQGLVATDYIETTTTSVSAGILEDMPRLDYSGGASCPSLLLEPQRSNLVAQSEYLDSWTNAGTTTTLSSTTNPSGYAQSYVIAASTSATNALRYDLTFSASTDYSYSLFLKAGTSEEVRMQIYDGNTFQRLAVNPLNDFAVVDQSGINSYSIENYGSGLYRVVMNFTTTASASSGYLQIYPDRTGNLNNVEVWGAQIEAGSYPTSYIPTYGSSVTRSGDSCAATSVGDVIGQTEGVLFVEMSALADDGTFRQITLSDGTSSNLIHFDYSSSSNGLRVFTRRAGVASSFTYTMTDTTANAKFALRYAQNDFALFIDGVKVVSNTTCSIPVSMSDIEFDNGSGSNQLEANLKQFVLFPTALTDSECIALTTL